jgi:allantoicase
MLSLGRSAVQSCVWREDGYPHRTGQLAGGWESRVKRQAGQGAFVAQVGFEGAYRFISTSS